MDDFTVHPETRSGDPFAVFGVVEAKLDECPHGCIDGVVCIGHMVEDSATGEEVEVVDEMPCRKCSRQGGNRAGSKYLVLPSGPRLRRRSVWTH